MENRTFYAARPEPTGVKIYRFSTLVERNNWVAKKLHAHSVYAKQVPMMLRANGCHVRFATQNDY